MKRTVLEMGLAAGLMALLGVPASAQRGAGDRPTVARAELIDVVERVAIRSGAEPTQIATLRTRLQNLDADRWREVERFLDTRPGWRALPAVLERNEDAEARRAAFRALYGVPAGDLAPGTPEERERFRVDFLFMIDQLRELSPLMEPGWDERLHAISSQVSGFGDRELEVFEQAYVAQMASLVAEHPEALDPGVADPTGGMTRVGSAAFDCPSFTCRFSISIPNACAFLVCIHEILDFLDIPRSISFDACTATGFATLLNNVCKEVDKVADGIGDFVSDAGTAITGAFNEVVGFANALPTHLENLVADIVGGIESVLAELGKVVPQDFDSFVAFLGDRIGLDVTSPDWWHAIPGLSSADAPVADDPDRVASAVELGALLPCPAAGLELPVVGTVGTPAAEFTCNNAAKVYGEFVDFVPSTAEFFVPKLLFSIDRAGIDYLCLCLEHSSKQRTLGDTREFRTLVDDMLDDRLGTRASQAGMDALGTALAATDAQILLTDGTLRTTLGNAAALGSELADHTGFVEDLETVLRRLDLEDRLLDTSDVEAGVLALPAALGGALEEVRAIVRDAVDAAAAAQQPIFNAEDFLARGDRDYSDGLYDRAYDNYQRAYGEAVKVTGN
ncbi:MAG TPA: hypothetical protein VMV46_17020 [Thermoanaerobaculia bacterium]|nr:hypothetical protein [Thermoanaerobaculia bacterium]